jgi:hypothetical protein
MSAPPSKSLPSLEDVRDVLEALGSEAPPDEREFAARLHRRLVASGAPPPPSWLEGWLEGWRESWLGWLERLHATGTDLWQETSQKRSLLTGAVLGALAMATAFMLLSGGRPLRDGNPAARPSNDSDETADVDGPGAGPTEHKSQRAVGDRRPTRDRLGEDIGAERPERSSRDHVDLSPTHRAR